VGVKVGVEMGRGWTTSMGVRELVKWRDHVSWYKVGVGVGGSKATSVCM